jgi:GGDEF domain-containing protein
MGFRTLIVFHSPSGRECPQIVTDFAAKQGLQIECLVGADEVLSLVNRTLPAGVVIETDGADASFELCQHLKSDTFSAIIPIILLAPASVDGVIYRGLEAGADEVLTEKMEPRERMLRLHCTLNRAHRDVGVHPTTRLAGTGMIERDMADRMHRNETFAVCYADLDHFKEFNDRYGYNEGDRVILLLSRILRDVVKAYAPTGFIGHIGGDDFIFNVPIENMRIICEEIIEIFDELIPFQYTEEDRRAGYFLGRDRRGNILWVPLMTLSVGVVTNQVRHFTHTARVSELATEMKIFAKKLPGSIYAVDRRSDSQDIYIEPAGFSPDVDMPIEP